MYHIKLDESNSEKYWNTNTGWGAKESASVFVSKDLANKERRLRGIYHTSKTTVGKK